MTTVYRCAVCGGENVEHAHWVGLNDDTIGDVFGSWCEDDSSWCNDCEEHVQITAVEVDGKQHVETW